MRISPTLFARLALAAALFHASARADTDLDAARAGDAGAQVRLGYAFRDGKAGREKSNRQAVEWFTRAADQGNAEGLDNLGWLVEHGTGTRADPARARELYRQAAKKGNPQAMRNLARVLRNGIGGEKDPGAAFGWSRKAFELEPTQHSERALAEDLLAQPSLKEYATLLERLATSTHGDTLQKIAGVYQTGRGGVPRDPDRAGVLFERARQAGLSQELLTPAQLDALATRTRVKGRFAYLPTTHLDQGHNMCAPTSAAMVLAYYRGTPPDPYDIKRHASGSERVGTGTSWDHLLLGVKTVAGHTWGFRSYPVTDAGFEEGFALLRAEADAGRVVLIDLGPHTVVFAGYDLDAKVVYIQNPALPYPGVHTVSLEKLRKTWHSPRHVTTQTEPARPLLLTGASAR